MSVQVTYAVFYRHKIEPQTIARWTPWFDSYEEAKAEAEIAKKNERFLEVMIVKRTVSFEFIE